MVFPWISYLEVLQKAQVLDMGDIEYLAIKEFDGKYVHNEGSKSSTGPLATLTASVGKDMYLAVAALSQVTGGGAFGTATIELQINGIPVETINLSTDADLGNIRPISPYYFVQKGHKVTTTQVIKLEVIAISNMTVEGNIGCFEEDTGTTPQIPPL